MIRYRMTLAALVALAIACLMLSGGVRAQERGATLSVEGTSVTVVDNLQVAAARQRERVVVSGTGFQARELVGLWLTLPDGSVSGLDHDDIRANAQGEFVATITLSSRLPTGLHRFTARGQTSGRGDIARLVLLPGYGPAATESVRLVFTPSTARQLDTVSFSGSGFDANEPVALWVTLPSGAVVGLGHLQADGSGVIAGELELGSNLPVGRHRFTARGVASGNATITPFVLQYGNGLDVPGAQLAADIGRTRQQSRVELSIQGSTFQPNEPVAFWLTLPDGRVMGLGDVRARSNGSLTVIIPLDEDLPTGTHFLSFLSKGSNRAGFALLVLEPGPSDE